MCMIFTQERVGYRGKSFMIYKFRTMDKDEHVTKLGYWLRKTGLDELPQLWNILKGDLVLVGPRPLTPWDHDKFRGFELPVKPGMTGWWQIHGRVQADIRCKDVEYILRKSWWLDLYIVWKTIPLVLLGRHG